MHGYYQSFYSVETAWLLLTSPLMVQYKTQHIQWNQLSEDSIFSNVSKYAPKVNFEISHILESLILTKLLEGFDVKTTFSWRVKIDFWIIAVVTCTPILYLDTQTLKSLFSKSTFHQSVLNSSMEFYFENAMLDFTHFCTKIELKEQVFRKYQKVYFELLTQLVPFNVLSHILAFHSSGGFQ